MNLKEFQELSTTRLKEAQALLDLDLWDGAYYLAGYSVECALKACIAKTAKRFEFPDKKRVDASHSHNLRELIKIAGLENARIEIESIDEGFRINWETVQSWSEQSRYRRHTPKSAQELVTGIGDKRHGVMRWIKLHW